MQTVEEYRKIVPGEEEMEGEEVEEGAEEVEEVGEGEGEADEDLGEMGEMGEMREMEEETADLPPVAPVWQQHTCSTDPIVPLEEPACGKKKQKDLDAVLVSSEVVSLLLLLPVLSPSPVSPSFPSSLLFPRWFSFSSFSSLSPSQISHQAFRSSSFSPVKRSTPSFPSFPSDSQPKI